MQELTIGGMWPNDSPGTWTKEDWSKMKGSEEEIIEAMS
jgi:hypothetical protein